MADTQDLRKLGRGDLMDLLLDQMKENEALEQQVKLLRGELAGYEESFPRLKAKLDGKDAQIEHLKERLDDKDSEIARLQAVDLDNPGSLAAAALKASGVMQAAEQAAAQYLEGARQIEVRRRKLYQETVNRCQAMERSAAARGGYPSDG